jgi:hypothetical protein
MSTNTPAVYMYVIENYTIMSQVVELNYICVCFKRLTILMVIDQ